ncbi:disease resistance protein Roq1-like isoform X2 [Syzygium oleosum]|uniref:disease resistance protein Roq1-like isoform X2 n=1 Tax=Syzygium oleosum TaxID=219896 RepID=UPI0024BB71DC|nr:disease resistance protein Roq1-like isoform X2 [Syzygium oleosum]
MAASSSNPKRNYHVFLSFRGTDVRNNFLGHLYAALDQKGIHTFMDSKKLRKGEQISPALMKAIEESRAAIIIFSEDYASSPWCLEELARIMECKEQRDLKVFPVFYKVKPREVRTPRKSYREAMDKHESKFGKDPEKVKRWEKALFDAGSLSGWSFLEGDEAELIQYIVKELSIHLEHTPLHVAKYPVGIDSQVQTLISLSQKESGDNDVLMIGLWGLGGIGKTTIAKALYNAIERQFQGSSFLARVRESSDKGNGLVALQEKLLSEILSHRHLTVYSVDGGINLIRERLCCKKVLLVLDDVDQLDQLNALAGEGHWFGKGSRIIVTSRDKHLLNSHGINFVYEVKTLDDNEALELFGRYAFPNSKKVEIRRDLIDRALRYANGLPLALEVLGSFLFGRNEPAWESTLRKLSKSPDKTIKGVLKTSFDGVRDNEREIFLDIACFFKGKRIEDIKEILDSCDFNTTIGIEILVERSLITYEHGYLEMHDLVQSMGKDIVNQECPDDPGKRSRLWTFEDVQDILFEDTGTTAVKAIVLDSPEPEEITISPHAFTNTKRLRMLILHEVHISSQGPVRLPNELRWLKWANAPDLEFGPGRKKLVAIDVQGSPIKRLEGKFMNFGRLKSINFSRCESLASVPDLSMAPNLESLNLDYCESLVEVHQSVGYLDKLRLLSLTSCSNLSIFPSKLKTKSLRHLSLSGCSKLEKFPDILGKMEHVEEFHLGWTAIKELPASIENLVSLKRMHLFRCDNLTRLPLNIYKLHNLEVLSLQRCLNLVMFPKNLEDSTNPDDHLRFPNLYSLDITGCNLSEVDFLESFPKLKYLYLSENKFTHLPTCINKYDNLKRLDVERCPQLQEIPQLPSNMHILRANGCKSLQKLPNLSRLSSDYLKVDLSSCCELFRRGVKMGDVPLLEGLPKMGGVDVRLIGGEMPEWFLYCKEDSISFMVPRDLYDKFLGLALCVVLGLEEGKMVYASCNIQIFVNGRRVISLEENVFYSLESDNVWLIYFPRPQLFEVEKHLRNEESLFQVCLRPWGASIKKWGFRLICEQQEDDMRVVLQHHQPIENKLERGSEEDNSYCSEEDNSIDTTEEDSPSETDAGQSKST